MNPTKPYLLRAFYEWISDNDLTPYLIVDAEIENIYIPREYVEEGRMILNISTGAVDNLVMNNHSVEFDARFSGRPWDVYVPMNAVMAIYAKENGRGMVFSDEDEKIRDESPPEKTKDRGKKPKLTIVK